MWFRNNVRQFIKKFGVYQGKSELAGKYKSFKLEERIDIHLTEKDRIKIKLFALIIFSPKWNAEKNKRRKYLSLWDYQIKQERFTQLSIPKSIDISVPYNYDYNQVGVKCAVQEHIFYMFSVQSLLVYNWKWKLSWRIPS